MMEYAEICADLTYLLSDTTCYKPCDHCTADRLSQIAVTGFTSLQIVSFCIKLFITQKMYC